jgi:hypothetical protein
VSFCVCVSVCECRLCCCVCVTMTAGGAVQVQERALKSAESQIRGLSVRVVRAHV